MVSAWISVRTAADLLGYSEDYFRRIFCEEDAPLLVIRSWKGPRGQRRVLVLRASVDELLGSQVKPPA